MAGYEIDLWSQKDGYGVTNQNTPEHRIVLACSCNCTAIDKQLCNLCGCTPSGSYDAHGLVQMAVGRSKE